MAEKIDLNVSPYYDDFNEDKKFHKVLFRAGRPIQARELTQTQSILQNQIERLGSFVFEEGSIVQGAQTDVDLDIYYVKVKSTNPNDDGDINVNDYIESFHGKFLRGQTTGVILKVITSTVETTDDPATLFVKFVSQGTDDWNSHNVYGNEVLEPVSLDEEGTATLITSNDNYFEVQTQTVTDIPVGYASIASIQEGIVYTRGYYVAVDAQTLILEKYNNTPSYKVGLSIDEQIVTSADDTSLNDNSQGTSNENAAGANRLKIELTLSKLGLGSTDDLNLIETARVEQGIIVKRVTEPKLGGIERTLARRTNDTNGDFIVQQFRPHVREHLNDYSNNGFYTELEGGNEDRFMFQVSPGKAYVRGFEITKSGSTNIPILKARTTISLEGTATPVRLGNELRVQRIFGLPDFGNEGGAYSLNEFGVLEIYDTAISSDGSTSGDIIGFSRVRDIRFHDGDDTSGVFDTSGDDIAQFNLALFDVKMFTKLTGTTSGATFTAGDLVVGSSSGATGIVAQSVTSGGSAILLHDVVGTFTTSDSISATTNAAAISSVTAVRTYNIDRARSVASTHQQTSTNFTADVVLSSSKTLQGSVSLTSGSDQMVGTFGTLFTDELKEGDVVVDSLGNEYTIESVEDDDAATLTTNASAASNGNVVRKRASLTRQDETPAIFAWSRDWVDTSTVSSSKVRRQQVVEVTSSGTFNVSKSDGETFADIDSRTGLTMAVISVPGGSDLSEGDVLDPSSPSVTVTAAGNNLTIGGSAITANDDGAKVLVSYTVTRNNPNRSSKVLNKARCLSVESASSTGVDYGCAYDHNDITLGVSDAFKVHGIYEGVGGEDPITPNAILVDPTDDFENFEVIVGQTSNAKAVIIKYLDEDVTHFYYTSSLRFIEGEYVVGQTSNSVATLNEVNRGSENITERYTFDDGQRDGYYDLAKISLKPNQPKPNGKILIVFDYFTGSGGDYYDVGSYGSIDYRDIPVYSPNRVDLGGLEPDGTYELSDAIDCRPSVGQILGDSSFSTASPDPTSPVNLSDVSGDGARYSPFSYTEGRSFETSRTNITTTKASPLDTPVDNSQFSGDIEFFAPRIDRVFLQNNGAIQVVTGEPSLTPKKPAGINDSIELFQLTIPAYTSDIERIKVDIRDHRRYTMKDIGALNTRLSNLERVTALSLLEKDIQSKQVLDSDGLDRFKSGFLVDNFFSSEKMNLLHPDNKCSIDQRKGLLRPQNHTGFIDLQLNTVESTEYAKTGDLVTLPFEEVQYISQPMASRSVNINPYNVFAYVGDIKLSPQSDTWVETKTLEDKNTHIDNYSIVYDAANRAGVLGEKWNAWQTSWVGEPTIVEGSRNNVSNNGEWQGDPSQDGTFSSGTQVTEVETITPETQTRNGINTSVIEYTTEQRFDRLVSVDILPYVRSRTVVITGTGFKPNTNHYFFFDNIRVDNYVKPSSSEYSSNGATSYYTTVRTDKTGKFIADFVIPNDDRLSFPVGTKELKVTSSFYNNEAPSSQGFANYYASGLLQSNQTEIVSTRNGLVVSENLSDSRDTTRTGTALVVDQYPNLDSSNPSPVEQPDVSAPSPTPSAPTSPSPSINSVAITGIDVSVPEASVGVALGTSTVTVSGGVPPYSYSWTSSSTASSGPATFSTAGGSGPSFTLSLGSRGAVNNYGSNSGTFGVTVTDSNGDTMSASSSYSLQVTQDTTAPQTYPDRIREDDFIRWSDTGLNSSEYPTATPSPYVWQSTRQIGIEDTVTESTISNLSQLRQDISRPACGWLDPLAQSFLVDSSENVSVTSVDLFFRTKSTSGVPVRVEIRNMVNGYPGSIILPFSSKTLDASDVNVSEDGTLATTFEFDSHVVLEPSTDYCVVIISNSDEYEAWVSRMGDTEISTGQQITTQPSMGSLFKSQNASTWTAEQTDDLKFNLNVASYETGTVGEVVLNNVDVPLKDLRTNPIKTFSGESYIRVLNTSHGMYSTDSNTFILGVEGDRQGSVLRIGNAALSGATTTGSYTDQAVTYQTGQGGTGMTVDFDVEDIGGTFTVTNLRISHVGKGYSVDDELQVANFEGSTDITFDVLNVGETLGGIPVDAINQTFDAIQDIDMDSFNIDLANMLDWWEGDGKLKDSWTALDTSNGGGSNVKCSSNIYYDLLHTLIPSITPANTIVKASVKTTSMFSPEGFSDENSAYTLRTTRQYIALNDNNFFAAPNIVASNLNETREMSSQSSLEIRLQLLSYSNNVSPIIDMDSVGCILNMNRINKIDSSSDVPTGLDYIASTEPQGDNNASIYITRRVNLENPATTLKVISDNFRPEGTELEFMYKIVRNDEETPIDEIGFEYFNTTGAPDVDIPADGRNFKEYEYTAGDLPEFSSFMIKIVGKSANTCIVPIVSSLRVLALA